MDGYGIKWMDMELNGWIWSGMDGYRVETIDMEFETMDMELEV